MSQMRKFSAVALIVIVTTQVVACTRIDPGQGRANDAWSQRLAGQAQAQKQEAQRMERTQAAWSQRLAGQARAQQQEAQRMEPTQTAWSQRLTEQADAYRAERARVERANAAYAQRLTGLAELAEHRGVGD